MGLSIRQFGAQVDEAVMVCGLEAMKGTGAMRHEITGVAEGSAAYRHGIQSGDVLLKINGEDIVDTIDYQALAAQPETSLTIERDGSVRTVALIKEDWEPIGLRFGDSMTLKPRTLPE